MAVVREVTSLPERTPPQNVELEMCVLGGIMIEPKEAYPIAADYLTRESFYLDGHGIVFELMGELYNRGIPPDAQSVLDELRARELLEKIGGSGVLMGMLNAVPTAANVEYHARKVAEKAQLRLLIRSCTEIVDECYRQEMPVEDVLDSAEEAILKLSEKALQAEFSPIAAALGEYMKQLGIRAEEVERQKALGIKEPRISLGVPTGFASVDRIVGGLRNSELTIIAARPSVGKTALGLNMAYHIATRERLPVAIFSLEMGKEQLAERLLACGTLYTDPQTMRIRGISTRALQNPDLDADEWSVLQGAFERVQGAPIYIDDSSMLTTRMLRSKVRRLHAHYGVRCIIVDYLQLMSGRQGIDNRVQEVSEISRGLKLIARERGIPVIALSQLSRQVEHRTDKRPVLADLRESGAIEQDADVVMFIHRPEKDKDDSRYGQLRAESEDEYTLPKAEIIVAKNRNGPTGKAELFFYPPITRFLDPAKG